MSFPKFTFTLDVARFMTNLGRLHKVSTLQPKIKVSFVCCDILKNEAAKMMATLINATKELVITCIRACASKTILLVLMHFP